jgi:hypothetical protein
MKSKILNLGVRSFLGFDEEGENDLEWLELKNESDITVFRKDLHNFLVSKYMYDFLLLFDKRALDYGFNSSLDSDDRYYTYDKYYSMVQCLNRFKKNSSKYICLTIGGSHWFPNLGSTASDDDRDFPYPELKGLKNIHIAEIHGCADTYSTHGETYIQIHHYYRISVYEIDGIASTVKRLTRFENGKVIDESDLKQGEDLDEVLHFSNFNSPIEYRNALEAEGIGFGLSTCCRPVAETMKKYNISFADAMRGNIGSGSLIMVRPENSPTLEKIKKAGRKRNNS